MGGVDWDRAIFSGADFLNSHMAFFKASLCCRTLKVVELKLNLGVAGAAGRWASWQVVGDRQGYSEVETGVLQKVALSEERRAREEAGGATRRKSMKITERRDGKWLLMCGVYATR